MPPAEHYIFHMTEGVEDPQPLYGACLRTAEVVTSTRNSYGKKIHHVAPRVYCLLSRAPVFDALFATLHAVLRLEVRLLTEVLDDFRRFVDESWQF